MRRKGAVLPFCPREGVSPQAGVAAQNPLGALFGPALHRNGDGARHNPRSSRDSPSGLRHSPRGGRNDPPRERVATPGDCVAPAGAVSQFGGGIIQLASLVLPPPGAVSQSSGGVMPPSGFVSRIPGGIPRIAGTAMGNAGGVAPPAIREARALGAGMDARGAAYQTDSRISLPALVGEMSLCLWLLVKGVDVSKWKARASAEPALKTMRCEWQRSTKRLCPRARPESSSAGS
jgi:hypothetical protein